MATVDADRLVRGTDTAWARLLQAGEAVGGNNAVLTAALPQLLDSDPPATDALTALAAAHAEITEELQEFSANRQLQRWRAPVASPVGPIPRITYLHASAYRAALTTLDLLGDADPSTKAAVDAGVTAFVDVLGAICARAGTETTVTVRTERLSLSLATDASGWRIGPGSDSQPSVRAEAATLLQITSGRRADVVALVAAGRLRLHDARGLLPLAEVVANTEGIPGTAAMRPALAMMQGASRLTGWLRRC